MRVKINWLNILLVVLLAAYLLLYIPERVSSVIGFNAFKKDAAMTEGIVESVSEHYIQNGEGYHREWQIYYTYKVGNEQYSGSAEQALMPVKKGEVLKIYYRPEEPSDSAADISANIGRYETGRLCKKE